MAACWLSPPPPPSLPRLSLAPQSALLLPLLLPLLLLMMMLMVTPASGCVSTVWQLGTLPNSELLLPPLNMPPASGSCSCCGLCYQLPDCASLSFGKKSGVCRLYRTVPDFKRLRLDEESAVLVRPGRSGHHQFCRFDSDCLEKNERCYGRICTTDPTVTCRDLAETYGAPENGHVYGSINGTTMRLYCRTMVGMSGWTLIVFSSEGFV